MSTKAAPFTKLTATQEQRLLELYDYCNKQVGNDTHGVEVFEANGLLSKAKVHWFQLIVEYIVPTLFSENWKWQDIFMRTILGRQAHPVDYLFDKYQKIQLKVSLYDNTQHDYVLRADLKEESKKARAKKERAEKSAGK